MDVAFLGPVLNAVVPLTLRVVTHVGALGEHERAHLALGNQFSGLGKVTAAGDLRTHLHFALGAFHRVIKLKGFTKVTGHRLLDIHVLATFHGIDTNALVPVVDSGTYDPIDIFSLNDFTVIGIGLDLVFRVLGYKIFGIIGPMCGHITNCCLRDIVILSMLAHLPHVSAEAASTHAHVADDEFLICALHVC